MKQQDKNRRCKHPRRKQVEVDCKTGGREVVCGLCNHSLRYLPPVKEARR